MRAGVGGWAEGAAAIGGGSLLLRIQSRNIVNCLSTTALALGSFPSENPKRPVRYSNVFRRTMRPGLKRIGLGHINLQAMRRTFASQGKASGVDAKTRSDIMGHSVDVHENEYDQTPFDVREEAGADSGEAASPLAVNSGKCSMLQTFRDRGREIWICRGGVAGTSPAAPSFSHVRNRRNVVCGNR
jgi:hypothetical protein